MLVGVNPGSCADPKMKECLPLDFSKGPSHADGSAFIQRHHEPSFCSTQGMFKNHILKAGSPGETEPKTGLWECPCLEQGARMVLGLSLGFGMDGLISTSSLHPFMLPLLNNPEKP